MPNFENIIKSHNSNIINSTTAQESDTCNFCTRENCPLPRKCTNKNIVYQCNGINLRKQIGLISNTFKTRHSLHKISFTNKEKRNSTKLSKYIWKLKDNNTAYRIECQKLSKTKPYTPASTNVIYAFGKKYHSNSRPDQHPSPHLNSPQCVDTKGTSHQTIRPAGHIRPPPLVIPGRKKKKSWWYFLW